MDLFLVIKVVPSSAKQAFKFDKSGNLKCYLKSAPERGHANLELIKFLAKSLDLKQDQVQIIAGATSRNKKIKLKTILSYEQLLQKLGIEVQTTIF